MDAGSRIITDQLCKGEGGVGFRPFSGSSTGFVLKSNPPRPTPAAADILLTTNGANASLGAEGE